MAAPKRFTQGLGDVGVTSEQGAALKELCAMTGYSRAHHVREALDEYLAKQVQIKATVRKPTLRWYLRPALQAEGLPATFRLHDLRHTAASLWLAAGIEPYKVSRWLGHSTIALTDSIYAHLYPTDYAAERAAFDQQGVPKPKAKGPVRRLAR